MNESRLISFIKGSVTGTSFNVNASPFDKEVNITLVEGSVKLSNTNCRFLSKKEPGENARIDMSAFFYKSLIIFLSKISIIESTIYN